jgi:hypothetical protein
MRFIQTLSLLLLSLPAIAGGFYIELGTPSASKETAARDASLVARLTGCHQPERGTLRGTAEGVVNGKRQSIPIKVAALPKTGMFAVQQTWPKEGQWVLHLTATHPGVEATTTTLVKVNGKDFERGSAKYFPRAATAAEVNAFLQ